jgi:hypothetical protein
MKAGKTSDPERDDAKAAWKFYVVRIRDLSENQRRAFL